MSGTVILTGAPGTGKSSVLDELAIMLEVERVPFSAIETEHLGRGWPWPRLEESIRSLSAVIEIQRGLGRDSFIVVVTTETEAELEAVKSAVGGEPVLVVCLVAPADVVAGRISEREPDAWPGKAGLVAHARELAGRIPALAGIDLLIGTGGRRPAEVANEIRRAAAGRGLLA